MFDKELNQALLNNLKLKAKIVGSLFAIIFIIQVIVITFLYATTNNFTDFFSLKLIIIGPLAILSASAIEFYGLIYYKRLSKSNKQVSNIYAYTITFLEISFPSLVILFAGTFLKTQSGLTVTYLLNSPPIYVYFIMILLTTLMLDFKLSVFAGVVAGIEFIALSAAFVLRFSEYGFIDYPNYIIRGLFMVICGAIAGLVSKKIKEAIVSSLESKNTLINKLDGMVKEQTAEITEQKEELIQKNKDITDSITYAQRIQTSILPKASLITEMFPENFVLYRPKDIVSGDFYWAGSATNKKIIAAVDCTGHGVPGAFMSMVGSALLNEIVNEKRIIHSDEILNALREKLIHSLQQTGAEGENKDGMDISLCVIDEKIIEFSGANNPLYLIRDNKLTEIKGNKQPIGIYHGETKSFTKHVIEYKKGDCIYLFTDGYADQFGGEKGKKFLYKKFQQLLLTNVNLTLVDQKTILSDVYTKWKGEIEQVDDVCIIGIRL